MDRTRKEILFQSMNATYDKLERVIDGVECSKKLMTEAGLVAEYDSLLMKLNEALDEFGDFMPGIEMDLEEG